MVQLHLQLLFAQPINNRRHALGQAEEGEDDDGGKLLGLLLNEPPPEELGQDEVHKVWEDEDCQLGAVQGDGPTAGQVAPVDHPQPPSLQQDPHVAVEDEHRAQGDEDHLLQLAVAQLLPTARAGAPGVLPEEQTEGDGRRQEPAEPPQQPGPEPARRGVGGVAHGVAHGAVAVHSHEGQRQEDVGAAGDQDAHHGPAGVGARPGAQVDLVVEDAAHAEVEQGRQQQVEDQHEARVAAEQLHAQDGGADEEVEEKQQSEGDGGDTEADVGVAPV